MTCLAKERAPITQYIIDDDKFQKGIKKQSTYNRLKKLVLVLIKL
jgi:hypothetical protein